MNHQPIRGVEPILKTGWATIREVARDRGWTEHHVRLLIRKTHIDAKGKGPSRRVSWESVERWSAKTKRDISVDISVSPDYSRTVVKILRTVPALSEPHTAARRLGIPEPQFDRMVAAGDVPVVGIGTARFVPAHWLARRLSEAYGQPVLPVGTSGRKGSR
jgi:hypothetical protein